MNISLKSSKRERQVSYSSKNNVVPIEKIVAILSYFTWGIVGFAWLLLAAFMKQTLRPFVKYHIYQSVFLSILFVLFSHILVFVINLLGYIPVVNIVVGAIVFFLKTTVLTIGWMQLSIIDIVLWLFILYLSLGAYKSKYSYVPWVSDIIKYNINRS